MEKPQFRRPEQPQTPIGINISRLRAIDDPRTALQELASNFGEDIKESVRIILPQDQTPEQKQKHASIIQSKRASTQNTQYREQQRLYDINQRRKEAHEQGLMRSKQEAQAKKQAGIQQSKPKPQRTGGA